MPRKDLARMENNSGPRGLFAATMMPAAATPGRPMIWNHAFRAAPPGDGANTGSSTGLRVDTSFFLRTGTTR